MTYDRAITQSVCAFNQRSNHLIADSSMIDSFSLHKLHSNYCMSLYGCEYFGVADFPLEANTLIELICTN